MTLRLAPAALAAVVCVAGALAWTGSSSSAQRSAGPPAAVVAVIDLEKALNGLEERVALEADFNTEVGKLQKKIDDLEKKIKDKDSNVNILPVGPERKAATEDLRRLVYEYEFEKNYSMRVLDERKGDLIRDIYQKIDQAAETLAKKNGYTMVLASDEKAEVKSGRYDDVRRMISLKRMLYVDPRHDITDEMVTLMNNEYATKRNAGGGAKPATPPPAPAPKDGTKPADAPKPPAVKNDAKPGEVKPKP